MKPTKTIARLLATALCALLATASPAQRPVKVTPSRDIITRVMKEPPSFDRIEIHGTTAIEYRQSDKTEIYVSGPDNLLDLLKVAVEGGTLWIGFEQNVQINGNGQQITVFASGPALHSVEASGVTRVALIDPVESDELTLKVSGCSNVETGILLVRSLAAEVHGSSRLNVAGCESEAVRCKVSGASNARLNGRASEMTFGASGSAHLTATGLDAGHIDITASGAATCTLSGRTDRAALGVSGAAHIEAFDLSAVNVAAEASGAGHINCQVAGKLKANATGSSRITYDGNPTQVTCADRSAHIRQR